MHSDPITKICKSDCTFPALPVGAGGTIALPSNPSTGYSWSLNKTNGLAEVVSEGYVRGTPSRMGSGGMTIFRFRTISVGTASLQFVYQRPWSGDVAKRVTVQIPVQWSIKGGTR